MEQQSGGGLFKGLIAGAAIGVAIGLLYAPRPGRETREMIRQKAEDIRCQAEGLREDLKEKAEDISDTVKERMKEISHTIRGNGSGKIEAC